MPEDLKKKVVVIGEDDEPIATLLRDSINDEDGYQAMREASPSPRDRARYARLARVAAQIVVAVGEAIAVEDTAIITRKRGRSNFATAADPAAEKAIVAKLADFDPSIPVLAEESARKELASAKRLWVVD